MERIVAVMSSQTFVDFAASYDEGTQQRTWIESDMLAKHHPTLAGTFEIWKKMDAASTSQASSGREQRICISRTQP